MTRTVLRDHDDEPDPVAHVERIFPPGELAGRKYHEKCGYRWTTHDQLGDPALGWTPPWGCPTEALARERWGRE